MHTASEEQFKVFTMPKVSTEIKFKLIIIRAVAGTKWHWLRLPVLPIRTIPRPAGPASPT